MSKPLLFPDPNQPDKMKPRKILLFTPVIIILSILIFLGCRGRQVAMRQRYVPYTEEEIRGQIIYYGCTTMCHQCARPPSPRAYTRAEWEKILSDFHPSPGPGAKIIIDLSQRDKECLRAYCMAEARDAPVVPRPPMRYRTKGRPGAPGAP